MTKKNKKDISILTKEGYFRRFLENCRGSTTYQDAYELTEKQLFEGFGVNRYKTYSSFANQKSKFFRSNPNFFTKS